MLNTTFLQGQSLEALKTYYYWEPWHENAKNAALTALLNGADAREATSIARAQAPDDDYDNHYFHGLQAGIQIAREADARNASR